MCCCLEAMFTVPLGQMPEGQLSGSQSGCMPNGRRDCQRGAIFRMSL